MKRLFGLLFILVSFVSISAQPALAGEKADSTFYRVDLALKNPGACAYLFLEYDSIRVFPRGMESLTNLHSLTFRYCRKADWEIIFQQLALLPSLRALEISICEIKSIPESISRLPMLRRFSLQQSMVVEIPMAISECMRLEKINLAFNPQMNWNQAAMALSGCKNLRTLDVSNCLLSSIPAAFSDLKQVREMHFSGNRFAETVDFTPLSFLQHVYVSNMETLNADKLFSQLSSFVALKTLIASGNDWLQLPELKGGLLALEVLDLSGNLLTQVPASFSNLTQLRELNLGSGAQFQRSNQVATFPEGNYTAMEVLIMNGNKMQRMPQAIGDMKNLKVLKMNRCELREISPALRNCTELQILEINHNRINSLPDWIHELSKLQVLKADGDFFAYPPDKVSTLPPSIGELTMLQELSLRDQLIQQLPENFTDLKNLQILDLRNNLIQKLPENFSLLTNLRELNLKANELKHLPPQFRSMKSLRSLNIAFNESLNMTDAVIEIQYLTGLTELDISFNRLSRELFEALRQQLPRTTIVAKGFNNLVPIGNERE